MKKMQRFLLATTAAIGVSVAVSADPAYAQNHFPSKPIRIILELPDVKHRSDNMDFVAAPTTPAKYQWMLRADLQTSSGVAQLAGLRPK